MISPWHVVLRDVMVFLAALSLFVTSLFMALVGWQLWRLARELYGDSEPIVASARRLVDGVTDTVGYVSARVIAPSADAVSGVRGASGTMRDQIKRFYGSAGASNGTKARTKQNSKARPQGERSKQPERGEG